MAKHTFIRPELEGRLDDGSTYRYRGSVVCEGACTEMLSVMEDCGCFPTLVQGVSVKFCPYCGEPLVRED